jgi:hypothetical protein
MMRKLRRAVVLACLASAFPAAAADPYLFDVIKQPACARALTGLLQGARGLPEWTRNLVRTRASYVGTPVD